VAQRLLVLLEKLGVANYILDRRLPIILSKCASATRRAQLDTAAVSY
jgi:hypothetical protein